MEKVSVESAGDPASERFRRLYAANYTRLVGYAVRRATTPDDAADVVAETFLVAWRNLHKVPRGEAAPWLFGIARGVLANQRRGERRRSRLAQRVGLELRTTGSLPPDVTDLLILVQSFAELSDGDREVLSLSAWEGLDPRGLAMALDCTSGAAKVRLSRARERFRQAIDRRSGTGAPEEPDPPPPRSAPSHPTQPLASTRRSHDT